MRGYNTPHQHGSGIREAGSFGITATPAHSKQANGFVCVCNHLTCDPCIPILL